VYYSTVIVEQAGRERGEQSLVFESPEIAAGEENSQENQLLALSD
jgi:hypothetical protein